LLALVPVVALGAVLGHLLNADVQQRYIESSRSSAALITQVGIQPLLDAQELNGGLTPAEVAQVDQRLQGAAVSDDVRRIKVWNRSGEIVYSDNHALIGRTFSIDEDLGAALRGSSSASVTDGHDEENAGDNLAGPLVQAYVPLVFKGTSSPSGAFEVYLPYAPVQAAIDRESNQLYIFLAAGLALFYASMFPVAVLADRWRRRLVREAETTALANLAVLERLNRLKTEFLTRVSHQFRTALVGIQGFSEVIKDSDQLEIGEVKSFAADIYEDARRLDKAFGDLLELDRMETGRAILKISRVDIDGLVQQVADTVRDANPDHAVVSRLGASGAIVPCDRDRVGQALANVMNNAAKYSPPGSEVTVTTELAPDEVTISVRDQGPGMPRDFDNGLLVGYQAAPGTGGDGHRGGTGLGLPMARQIVEMHGGRIWFESAARGTTFHLAIPRRSRPSRQMAAAARNPRQGQPDPQEAPVRTPSSLSHRR
jgi:signal transduction histidine kinase